MSAPSSPHFCSHHSGLDCPFASLSPSLRPTRAFFFFKHMVDLSTWMNRCIIKWRDGHSLKGGSCSEDERKESTFSPLAEGSSGQHPARLRLRAPYRPLPAPCHPTQCPREGPLAGYMEYSWNVITTSTVSVPAGKLSVLKEWDPQKCKPRAKSF